MFSHPERLIIALMIALLFAGVTLVAAEASSPQSFSPQSELPCEGCHSAFMESWQSGPHGQATIDPVFNEAWDAQGNPGACLSCHTTGFDPETGTWEKDGVSCEACHSPIPEDHPKNPAPIERSPILCGNCHSDVRFGWEEWEVSSHFQRDITCINCHDPHMANVKSLASASGDDTYDDASSLCLNCHKEYIQNNPNISHFNHVHNNASCVDCHLTMNKDLPAHTVPDHSFQATLSACINCHEDEMHQSTETNVSDEDLEEMLNADSVASKPSPVSPLGFAGLASLIGIAAGTVLAPWLEGKYKAIKDKGSNQDEH